MARTNGAPKEKARTIAIPETFYLRLKSLAEKNETSVSAEAVKALGPALGAKKRTESRTISVEVWSFSDTGRD